MSSRKINWVSSVDPQSNALIGKLEQSLQQYYSTSKEYYTQVDFTADNWTRQEELGYVAIASSAQRAKRICEIGCGQANILRHFPELSDRYSACDFSETLMKDNAHKYPGAVFVPIETPNLLPFQDNSFDLVFCVFVLEHSTRPAQLLKECTRILTPGGTLMILCPDFLGRNRMTSQRAGWSAGTATQKLKSGKWLDAMVTLFDNRIRIPGYCNQLKKNPAGVNGFYINVSPVVFFDPFTPDVDAVYVTYKKEIETFLTKNFQVKQNSVDMVGYENNHGVIFIEATKQKVS